MRQITIVLIFAVQLAGPAAAPAQADKKTLPDADTQSAKRHFDESVSHYTQGRYADALRELQIARQLKPAPEFDYNLAQCEERLEHWAAAADAYESFLSVRPAGADADAARERVRVLRARVQALAALVPAPPPPPPPQLSVAPTAHTTPSATSVPPPVAVPVAAPLLARSTPPTSQSPTPVTRRWWFWAALGGAVAVVAGVSVGLGVGLSSHSDPATTDGSITVRFP